MDRILTTRVQLNVIKAQIVRNGGPDNISLVTDLTEATWPFEENLDLKFICRAGDGEEYLRKHFPRVPVEVIDIRSKSKPRMSND